MKSILKGILLWFTAIVNVLWLLSISNMIELNRFDCIIFTTIGIVIIDYICYNIISYKELYTLSLYKLMSTYLRVN